MVLRRCPGVSIKKISGGGMWRDHSTFKSRFPIAWLQVAFADQIILSKVKLLSSGLLR